MRLRNRGHPQFVRARCKRLITKISGQHRELAALASRMLCKETLVELDKRSRQLLHRAQIVTEAHHQAFIGVNDESTISES